MIARHSSEIKAKNKRYGMVLLLGQDDETKRGIIIVEFHRGDIDTDLMRTAVSDAFKEADTSIIWIRGQRQVRQALITMPIGVNGDPKILVKNRASMIGQGLVRSVRSRDAVPT